MKLKKSMNMKVEEDEHQEEKEGDEERGKGKTESKMLKSAPDKKIVGVAMSSSSKRKLNPGPLDKSFAKRIKPESTTEEENATTNASPNEESIYGTSIDLCVDESYLLALIDEEPIPISDEKFAEELQFQEALYNSSSIQSIFPKTEDKKQKQIIKREFECGELSQSKLIFCGICMESKENPDMFTGLSICNHLFCVDCIEKYIGSKIKEKIGNIECPDPNCNRAIEPENCVSILPNEVFVRWETALFEASILGCQKFYCPFKDCSGLMVDDGEEEVRQSVCPHCNRMFCARCRVGWHEGVRCEEFEKLDIDEREGKDIMLKKLAKDKEWRRCSCCRFYVEKKEGCLHMTCRCRYEFCYKCGCQWSSTHAC